MMQRRVWQHHSEIRRAVPDVPCNVGTVFRFKKYDGRGLRFEKFLFRRVDLAVLVRHIERRHHQREGLLFAMLALAQTRDSRGLTGIDQKLKAANAFEGDDLSSEQRGGSVGDCAVKFRSANGASIGLRVKTAIGGIFILFATGCAERKL